MVKKPEESSIGKSEHSMLGILFMMLGSFSFSIMFLLVKVLKSANLFTVVFYRSLVQIFMSVIILSKKGVDPLGPPELRWELIARAVFGTVAVAAFFFGIQVLALPEAVVLQFTTPLFAATFAVMLVGEKWWPIDMVGALMCLSGVTLIAHPTFLFGSELESTSTDDDDSYSTLFMQTLAVLVTTLGAASAGVAYVMVRLIGK